jgi:hypothetical protein
MGGQGGFKAAVKESPKQKIIDAVNLATAASNIATSDVFSMEGQNTLKAYVYYSGGGAGTLTITVIEEDPQVAGSYVFKYTSVDAGSGVLIRKPILFTTGSADTVPLAIPIVAHNCKITVTHSTNTGVVTIVLRNAVAS